MTTSQELRVQKALDRFGSGARGSRPVGQGYVATDFYLADVAAYSANIIGLLAGIAISAPTEAASLAARKVLTYIDANIIKANDVGFGNVLYRAGEVAREATYAAYLKSIAGHIASYQAPNRLSGMLGKVLQEPGFVSASTTGVAFGNLALLNAEAKHWARLNYGAGAKGGTGASAGIHDSALVSNENPTGYVSRRTEFRGRFYSGGEIYNRSKGAATFDSFANLALNPGPRPAFTIPKGFWFGVGSDTVKAPEFTGGPVRDQFFPYSAQSRARALSSAPGPLATGKALTKKLLPYQQQRTETAGIAPHRFLDVGIRVLYRAVAQGVEDYAQRVTDLSEARGIGAEARRIQQGVEVIAHAEVKHFALKGRHG